MAIEPSLTELLATPPTHRPNSLCGVKKWIDSRPDDEKQAIQEALGNPDWKHVDLHALLQTKGLPIGITRFVVHRQGKCSCGR